MSVKKRLWFRDGPALVWQDAPGLGGVFDPASGETHFLSDLPGVILTVVDRTPASYSSLVERLGGSHELDYKAEAKILAALASLEAAELVESKAPATE